MSWLSKRDKLDPVQASAVDFAVAQEGKKKVEKVGGDGDAMAETGDQRGSVLNDTVVTIQSKAMGSAGGFILDHRDSHNRPVSAAF